MPRATYPGGYHESEPIERPIVGQLTWRRLRQEPDYRVKLRERFERVLLMAVAIWGADFVIARVQDAIADAETARQPAEFSHR
jgi:hypothetical protein